MRLRSLYPIFRDSRGSVMIFTMLTIIFLLVVGGLAVDFAHQFTLRNEIQRSMDAAALAAAGKIQYIGSGVIPSDVRDYALNFATKNKARTGTITLARNDGNDDTLFNSQAAPYGDVLTGHWSNTTRTFTKSLDARIVNAVMCRYKTAFPTSLFRLWGISEMSVQAVSIATSDPALAPPTDGCTVPIGLSQCSFQSNQIFTTNGCGTIVKFITSNTQADSTNTAAWVSLNPAEGANSANITAQVNAGASCTGGAPVGTTLNSNNGMFANAFDALQTKFLANYDPNGPTLTVMQADGVTPAYTGKGWEVYVPIMGNTCPAGAINGALPIVGWTRMVITQMWNPTGGNPNKNEPWNSTNQSCLVNNPSDSQTWAHCQNADPPSPLNSGNSRSVWGYYSCAAWVAPSVTTDAPLASMTDKLRIRR
jgi:Flp pilus assembly protein TadG